MSGWYTRQLCHSDIYRLEKCEEKTTKESQGEMQNPAPGKEQPCVQVCRTPTSRKVCQYLYIYQDLGALVDLKLIMAIPLQQRRPKTSCAGLGEILLPGWEIWSFPSTQQWNDMSSSGLPSRRKMWTYLCLYGIWKRVMKMLKGLEHLVYERRKREGTAEEIAQGNPFKCV